MHTLTCETVTALIEELAELLPFPTVIYTDMGADTWAPQLYFGPTDIWSELPTHRVGIEPDEQPTWWIDLDGGTETVLLDDVAAQDIRSVAYAVLAVQRKL